MGNKKKRNNSIEIIKKNIFNTIEWHENITILDLSNREIEYFDENIKLPSNLIVIDLSNNILTEVPAAVMKLEHLKTLDLSYNKIVLFDDIPNFCHSLENLYLTNNKLEGPPYWVWTEEPKNLLQLDLSYNEKLCQSFDDYYFEELLQYTTLVKKITLHNCKLGKYIRLMSTFRHATHVNLGCEDYNYYSINHIESVPCAGLEDCCDIQVLNLCQTNMYNVLHNIDMYQNLIEINLSQNNINSLPNEFCNLKNLEVCILSINKILYLPEDMHKLSNLIKLYLDNNELCMLPETFNQLDNLKILDLYNNHLYGGLDNITHLTEYDFAQNYCDEPIDEEYLKKKEKLREKYTDRHDGRAPEIEHETESSEKEFDGVILSDQELQGKQEAPNSRCSSPEDWDSDDYWIPSHGDIFNHSPLLPSRGSAPPHYTMQWLNFVKKKMEEGNFCPMDAHLAISITEKVKYDKMCNPVPEYESDGQFDDYSDDDT